MFSHTLKSKIIIIVNYYYVFYSLNVVCYLVSVVCISIYLLLLIY